MNKRFYQLKNLPLLNGMSHNGRVITLSEPFWSIPFNMFSVYAVLFMMHLGLSEWEIGITQTIFISTQILSSLLSGKVTDRLGRRRTALIFDMLSWAGACLVWALSSNFWGFAMAAFLNGIRKISYVSMNCLLTEEATSAQRLKNYSGFHFMIMAGGLFAPIGGLIVAKLGFISGTRLLYLMAALIMSSMFIIRHFFFTEPQKHPNEVNSGIFEGLGEAFSLFLSNKRTRTIFSIQGIFQFYLVFKPLFYFAFLKDSVGLDPSIISIIPLIMSLFTMFILLAWLPRVQGKMKIVLLTIGLLMGGLSLLLLVASATGSLFTLALSIILDSVSTALIRPLIESLWADELHDDKRTSQLSAGNFLFALLSLPAGTMAAGLYTLSPLLPFTLAAILLLLASVLSLRIHAVREKPPLAMKNL